MNNTRFVFGPVALTTTLTTNILNGNITSLAGPVGFTATQPFILLRHIMISNKTGSAATFSLWKGGAAGNVAGTEFLGTGTSIAANSYYERYGQWAFEAAYFLVGGSGTATALTIEGEGEIGFTK